MCALNLDEAKKKYAKLQFKSLTFCWNAIKTNFDVLLIGKLNGKG